MAMFDQIRPIKSLTQREQNRGERETRTQKNIQRGVSKRKNEKIQQGRKRLLNWKNQ